MHCLENLLLILAARVRDGNITAKALECHLSVFASYAHDYDVPGDTGNDYGENPYIVALNDEWNKKYQHLMIRK